MCGVACVIEKHGSTESGASSARLESMLEEMHWRGPDARCSRVALPGVYVGATRLAINDVENGHQPFTSFNGRISLFMNGEIYNHREIETELRGRGIRLSSNCDLEVLAHTWALRGEGALHAIDGVFAGLIVDHAESSVYAVRDHGGVRPLFWAETKDSFVVASTISAVCSAADEAPTFDANGVREYLLRGYSVAPSCTAAGVREVRPGSLLCMRRRSTTTVDERIWWRPRGPAQQGILSLLRSQVEREADSPTFQPVGIALSGGLDSSTVLALMPRDLPVVPLVARYTGAPDPDVYFAGLAARAFRRTAEFVNVHEDDARTAMHDWPFDRPNGDANIIGQWKIAERLSALGGRVLLGGEGADEVFCGYSYYAHVARWSVERVLHEFPSMTEAADVAFSRLLRHAPVPLQLPMWCTSTSSLDAVGTAQRLDLAGWLAGNSLHRADAAGLRYRVEWRVPFVARTVLEHGLSLPTEQKIGSADSPIFKRALREAVTSLLPTSILTRSKKGMGVPLDRWMRVLADEFREEFSDDGPWDRDAERLVWTEYMDGQRDWSEHLWRLTCLRSCFRSWTQAHRRHSIH